MPVQIKIRHIIFAVVMAVLALASCTKPHESLPAIRVVSSSLHVGPQGGVCKAVVKADGPFEAICEEDWCEVDIDADTILVMCLPNKTISERFATITLRCNSDKTDLSVSQDGQYSNLLGIPSVIVVGCSDIKLSYDITSNVNLTATTDHSEWCRVGVSRTAVMLTLSANPSMDARDCNVTFSTSAKEIPVRVHQKGRFVLDCDEPVVFPKSGGEFKCEFYSAEPYTITVDDAWVKYDVVGDTLRVYSEKTANLAALNSALTVTTQSGYSKRIELTQKLLPQDYTGSFDFCFRSGWMENNQIYEYAVEAEWDEARSEIVFDLVSYVLHFQYDPTDGFLYLHPQLAYESKTQPYNTWLSIAGTQKRADGSPDPSYLWSNPEITDWTNYYAEGSTFDTRYRVLFKWEEGSLDKMTMTHIAQSDFPIYNPSFKDGGYYLEYGNPDYFIKDCYGFRLSLNHVYYNSMEDERIAPTFVPGNHYPKEFRVDEHLPMYGPITLVRK